MKNHHTDNSNNVKKQVSYIHFILTLKNLHNKTTASRLP